MTRRLSILGLLLLVAACGGKSPAATTPAAAAPNLDSLTRAAEASFRRGKWNDAQRQYETVVSLLKFDDPRSARARFFLGETHLAMDNPVLAARELRRVADEGADQQLAPEALLRVGDAYAQLWRKPELDPSFGLTAISTYQEVQSRFPGSSAAIRAQQKVAELQERLAYKTYKAGLYYYRLRAYDSAIIYFRDLVATYPRSEVAPDALVKLVAAYKSIGYGEEVKETCGYMRRFHATAPGVADACKGVPGA